MKKLIIVALLILVLLLLVVPGAVGLIAENQFRSLSEELDQESSGLILAVEDYRRGWFSSRAKYRLSPVYPQMEGYVRQGLAGFRGWPSLVIDAEVVHGPVLFGALGRENASWLPAIAQSFDSVSVALADDEPIRLPGRMTTRLGFFGRYSNEIRVAPFTHEFSDPDEPGKLNWDGLQLSTRFGPALDKVALSGRIGAMEISAGGLFIRTGPVQLSSRQARSEYGLWAGDALLDWEGAQIQAPDSLFFVGKISAESSSSIAAGMFGQAITVRLAEVGLAGWKGGPGRMSMTLETIDARALGELSAIISELPVGAEGAGPGDLMPLVFPQLQALLAAGPHLSLRELSLETPDGTASLAIDLAFPESSPEAAFGFILGLQGSAHLRLPANLTDALAGLDPENAASVQTLIDIGFLTRDGNLLVLDAAVKNGLLTVNGQPVPLPLGF